MKTLISFLITALLCGSAHAATLAIKDGNGTAQNLGEVSDSGGSLYPIQVIGNTVAGTIVTAPVSSTLGVSVNVTGLIGQGSATAGQTGFLGMGSVTTASPSYTTNQSSPISLDTAGNLRVNVVAGGGTGGTSSSFASSFPTLGTAIGVKNGSNMVNLTADGSNNLNINCVVGCAGGTTSNAGSAVATSSTNGATVAWLYGFNGTTWDQLQDDGSKNLKVLVNGAISSGSNTIGKIDLLGNAGAIMDFAGQNAAAPANAILSGCEFNTAPTTITSGNTSPVQCDAKANELEDLMMVNQTAILTGAGATGSGAQRITVAQDSTTVAGSTTLPAGTNSIGAVTASQTITNPTATLAMTAVTTAYTAGQLIATSATAGSVVNPSFAIATSAGGAIISRVRLDTNDATGTAWGGQTVRVDLWTTTPTWTNGDRGTWSPATQTGAHLAQYTCTMSAEYGDGAFSECSPAVGNFTTVKLASGTSIFWSLDAITGSGVTGASKTWTLTAELLN